jgi:acyl carrier protein
MTARPADNDQRIKERVLQFMASKGEIPGATEDEHLAFAYLQSGLVDSMGIVEMIQSFEDEFDVRFEPHHLQSQDFQTVGGIIRLLQHLSR